MTVEIFEDVPALPIGVVEDDIEDGHALQLRVVGVDESDIASVHVAGAEHG